MMRSRRTSNWLFYLALIGALAVLPGAAGKNNGNKGKGEPTRYKGLDRDYDGRISRQEWRGNDRSFSLHDRNGDGEIAGAEMEAGRQDGVAGEQHDRFMRLDRDGNSRVTRDEWDGDRNGFDALDGNHDGALSRGEFMNMGEARQSLFHVLDVDSNGLVSRNEWQGDRQSFGRLDANSDRKLQREEFMMRSDDLERSFAALDRDHDGLLGPQEWRGNKRAFGQLDDNRDGRLSLAEFVGVN
jgi:Ca2+-binding EF-hand superfamily protein